jgi:hypothetical protein
MRLSPEHKSFTLVHRPLFQDHRLPIPLPTMPQAGQRRSKKRDEHSSAGEDFSEVSSTLNTDDESVPQDEWIFPVVSPHGKREEYAAVSLHCLVRRFD